jgi:hypothetical protein
MTSMDPAGPGLMGAAAAARGVERDAEKNEDERATDPVEDGGQPGPPERGEVDRGPDRADDGSVVGKDDARADAERAGADPDVI